MQQEKSEEREGRWAKDAQRREISQPQSKQPDKLAPKLNSGGESMAQTASHPLHLTEILVVSI